MHTFRTQWLACTLTKQDFHALFQNTQRLACTLTKNTINDFHVHLQNTQWLACTLVEHTVKDFHARLQNTQWLACTLTEHTIKEFHEHLQNIQWLACSWICLLVGWLLNVPATCKCISGTDLLRQFYVLPHWDGSCRSNFPSHPVTVYWHRANQLKHWPYNSRRLAG